MQVSFGAMLESLEANNVRDAFRLQIEQLQFVVKQDHIWWQNVIGDSHPNNICSGFDIFSIWCQSYGLDSMFCL